MNSAIEILHMLTQQGVGIEAHEGRLRVIDPVGAVTESTLATLREHKAELLRLLTSTPAALSNGRGYSLAALRAQVVANLAPDAAAAEWERYKSRPDLLIALDLMLDSAGDDRIACRDCQNLLHGSCAAAARGEQSWTGREYRPGNIDRLHRCEAYQPNEDDPDQRTGSERWANLAAIH